MRPSNVSYSDPHLDGRSVALKSQIATLTLGISQAVAGQPLRESCPSRFQRRVALVTVMADIVPRTWHCLRPLAMAIGRHGPR